MVVAAHPSPPDSHRSSRECAPRIFFQRTLWVLLAYTIWAWSGLRPSFHWVSVAAGAILLGGWVALGPASERRLRFRDPVFWLGLAFLGFLTIQWLNAGRVQYFDVGYQEWRYTPPRWPGWPSAFSRADALQMLAWFFPAWTIALSLRSRIWSCRDMRTLLMFIAYNAGALAIFGLVQFATGTSSIYWVQPLKEHFFATFPYGNHVAPFFVLVGALAAGLLYRELFDIRRLHQGSSTSFRLRHPWQVSVLVPILLLCLLGGNLGFSRSGVILSWALGVFVAGYGMIQGWRVLPPAGRLNFGALVLGVAGMLYFAVAGFGEKTIQKEFALKEAGTEEVSTLWQRIDLELGGRPRFAWAAIEIWQEHPWVGVGGWGYKYLVADHVPPPLWENLQKRGWANVHFDFLQFLAEFGVIGFSLLLGALGMMFRDLFRARSRLDSLWLMGGVGLGLVGVFSVIDLPFRCPAILYVWVAVLAALPRLCAISSRKKDWMEGRCRIQDATREATIESDVEREFVPERIGS